MPEIAEHVLQLIEGQKDKKNFNFYISCACERVCLEDFVWAGENVYSVNVKLFVKPWGAHKVSAGNPILKVWLPVSGGGGKLDGQAKVV